jgi:NAD(P) transhydrogenase
VREPGMSDAEFDLVCIGSGPAGQRAAIQAAKLGKRVAIIERQRTVGGVCVDTGTIPSKTFREAVRRVHSRQGFDGQDASDRERGRPSMAQLVGQVARVIEREVDMVHDVMSRNDVRLVHGRAAFEDAHTLRVETPTGARRLTAANILVAVGTMPSRPPGVEVDGKTITTSDTVLSLEQLPRTMVVVGAGVIGIEYASMFAALGVQVTVIDQRPRPLEFLDQEIVDELIHQMRKSDVVFRCGDAVAQIEISGNSHSQGLIHLASGKHLVGDVVLFSAGRIGATADLNLEAAGLAPDDRGRLKVDEAYRTSVSHIFAAGDVIGFPALAATSMDQGRLAAYHAFGEPCKGMTEIQPIGIYSIPEVSYVGATEVDLTKDAVPYEVGVSRYRELARGQIAGDSYGMLKLLVSTEDLRLLGVHIFGTNATEMVHIGQAVMGCGGTVEYLVDAVFNYPTFSEAYKVAALDVMNKLRALSQFKS